MTGFSRTALRIAATAVVTTMLALGGNVSAAAAPATAAEAPTAAKTSTAVKATTAAKAATATTGAASSTWTLVDWQQRLCATPNDPRLLYFFVGLEGTWSVPITAGYTGMPAGTDVLYDPWTVEPGSADGHHVQVWAVFRLSGAPLGRHVPSIWATDGIVTQSVPVILDIRSTC